MHTVHAKINKIFLFQISMNVKTLQWLLDVLRTPSVVTCPHISCASARLVSRVTVRWNVEVSRIYIVQIKNCHQLNTLSRHVTNKMDCKTVTHEKVKQFLCRPITGRRVPGN
jgi:hypothetical protein